MTKAKKAVLENNCKNCKGTGTVVLEDLELQSCPVCLGYKVSEKKVKDEDDAPVE